MKVVNLTPKYINVKIFAVIIMKKRIIDIVSILLVMCLFSSCDGTKTLRTKKITDKITQTSVVIESDIEEQEEFSAFLKDFKALHTIPGLLEGVIPQGLCYDETTGYLLISGYYEDEKFPSVIMAISEADGKFIGAYPLNDTNGNSYYGHVGGIASSQNTVYVTSGGECYTFPASVLIGLKNCSPITFQSKFKLNTAGSFACIYNNILWTGDFVENDEKVKSEIQNITTLDNGETFYAYCEGYILNDGLPNIKSINSNSTGYIPDYIIAIPEQVQGMAFTKTNKIIFSTSYGRKNNSEIYIFEDFLIKEKTGIKIIDGREVDLYSCSSSYLDKKITALPMAEGMANTADGVYIAFESGAKKYRRGGGRFPTDTLYFTTIE